MWFPVQAEFEKCAGLCREGESGVDIYFVRYQPNEFWMLTLYAKSKRENVPAHILKQLVEAFQNE